MIRQRISAAVFFAQESMNSSGKSPQRACEEKNEVPLHGKLSMFPAENAFSFGLIVKYGILWRILLTYRGKSGIIQTEIKYALI